jgi:hypothetical protein
MASSPDPRPRRPGVVADPLPDRLRAVLDFERDWRAHEGGKGRAIQAAFGFSGARYYQLLARAIDHPLAAAHDPLLVARLRRRRDQLARRRNARALGRGE